MGCTSSNPNMPEIAANTNESTEDNTSNVKGNVKEDEITAIENDLKDATVSKVLPICDSLEENLHIARNSNSFTKTDNEEEEEENHLTSIVKNEEQEVEKERDDNKLLSLKEVADQVILNTILDDIEQIKSEQLHQETQNNKEENIVTDTEETKTTELEEECLDEQIEATEGQDHIEESSSPSQSDGNRSTRWEALADIAAELPPSLAVDPITGQIYSLAK